MAKKITQTLSRATSAQSLSVSQVIKAFDDALRRAANDNGATFTITEATIDVPYVLARVEKGDPLVFIELGAIQEVPEAHVGNLHVHLRREAPSGEA